MKHQLYVETLMMDGVTTVKPIGRIDQSSGASFFKAIIGMIDRNEQSFQVDFSEVPLVTSAAARALFEVATIHSEDVQIKITNSPRHVTDLLKLCGLGLIGNIEITNP